MKILLLASYAESLIRFRGDLIKDLGRQGYQVVVCAPLISSDLRLELESTGAFVEEVELARTGLSPVKDFGYALAICRIIKKHTPTLVLTYTVKPNIWGAVAAWICRVKSISMITGLGFAFIKNNSLKQTFVGAVVKTLYRISTRMNHLVIFQNRDDAHDFIRHGCLKNELKVRFVNGSGVNTSYYQTADLPQKPIFLLIARLLFSKGIMEYAEAAEIVKRRCPEAKFLLAGFLDEGQDGLSAADLKRVELMGVEYMGELHDVRGALACSSVYVLPSYREGTPRSVLEAMAMSRPIITTDAPGCRETTIDGVNGFLVPVADSEKLAEKMYELAESGDMRLRFGRASRELAERKFAVEKVNSVLLGYIAE